MERGNIVQFRINWDKEPTPSNTSVVTRVARDGSWADVHTPYGNKRVPEPDKYLKLVKSPLTVRLGGGE